MVGLETKFVGNESVRNGVYIYDTVVNMVSRLFCYWTLAQTSARPVVYSAGQPEPFPSEPAPSGGRDTRKHVISDSSVVCPAARQIITCDKAHGAGKT